MRARSAEEMAAQHHLLRDAEICGGETSHLPLWLCWPTAGGERAALERQNNRQIPICTQSRCATNVAPRCGPVACQNGAPLRGGGASALADGLAVQNFEAAFQLGNLALAALVGAAVADLQAEPETAEPARQQKHDDEDFHGRADARSRRRRRPQTPGMVAKILKGPEQSDPFTQDDFRLPLPRGLKPSAQGPRWP